MTDKLKELLIKINLDEKNYNYFTDATFKVRVNPKKDTWTFYIKIKNSLPVDVYQYIKEALSNKFTNLGPLKGCFLLIKAMIVDYSLMPTYWTYTLEQLKTTTPTIMMFNQNKVKVENNKLVIEADNKAEYNRLMALKDKIVSLYKEYGFINVLLSIIINHKNGDAIRAEITKSMEMNITKPIIKKPINENVLYGSLINEPKMNIKDIHHEENNVIIEGYLFGVDYFKTKKNNFTIITLKVTDHDDSMYAKIFTRDDNEYRTLKEKLKVGMNLKLKGYTKNDLYAQDLVLNIRDINIINKTFKKQDTMPTKRVELHAHTHMSQMDSVVSVKDLIKRAQAYGHKAVAITDHNSVQAFPEAFQLIKGDDGFKVIYGVELTLIDDSVELVMRADHSNLMDNTYVVFDVETTGFNAASGDTIIEIGAVKIHHGKIIDQFSKLINPHRPLPAVITKITGITDEMLKEEASEEQVVKEFYAWVKDLPMVAHNAKFDASFLEMAYQRHNIGPYHNPLVDTLELSRVLNPNWHRHGLSNLVKRYDIPFQENQHHRAEYDAKATALIFYQMIQKLVQQNIKTLDEVKNLVSKDDLHKVGTGYHITLLTQNNEGLKNLFKIISLANTKYLYKTPRILRSEITKHRTGLLIGSACNNGEVFELARSKSDEELLAIMNFYDYIEVQPLSLYDHLVQMGDFGSMEEIQNHLTKIIHLAIDHGKLVVATGDVHQLDEQDNIYRSIIINQKVPGGGIHPLANNSITNIPAAYFHTTEEMLAAFPYLDNKLVEQIVITNTNQLADMIEKVQVIKDELYVPTMANAAKIIQDKTFTRAKEIYGDPLPEIIKDRLETELKGIISGGYDVIYLIAQKLVNKSVIDGYMVGSRGSVGSSLVATMLEITEVNPLSPHYLCSKCQVSIFTDGDEPLNAKYSSGYDLPAKKCTCGQLMTKEGNDMPFEAFLGLDGNKVPDIDLNFSSDYQTKAHDYTKELFGENNVFRAGTIGTVARKTAYGFVKGYMEAKDIYYRPAHIERLALGCVGVKRTTGQHPGGIIVIPDYTDIFEFTPYQYPADDRTSKWYTTHFDFHALENNVLKLDILGKDDPTMLKMLQDISGIDIMSIPFNDEKVLSLFSKPDALGVTSEQIFCVTGTLGLPEFGTKFVIKMLEDVQPKTVGDLLKISGLSHGTGVWLGNARDLIKDGLCTIKEVIGCREDIMNYLTSQGVKNADAFKIMEFVRKGKTVYDAEGWAKLSKILIEAKVPDWYIESCRRIQYLFPKSHATAYVMMGLRVAWFKVYHPLYYYMVYFSIKGLDFDLEAMMKGYQTIRDKVLILEEKGFNATTKETSLLEVLQVALEMTARGYKFGNIDLYRSEAKNFIIDDDQKTLIPPFRAVEGLGEIVAGNIVLERKKRDFISIEDLQQRTRLSSTLIERLKAMGVLDNLPVSSQLSLF